MDLARPFLIDDSFLTRQDSYRCNKSINFNVIASEYCLVYHLELHDFYSILRKSADDSAYFFKVYHKHNLLPDQWSMIECEYCVGKFHNKFDCPKIHYCAIKEVVIWRLLRDEESLRKSKDRPQNKLIKHAYHYHHRLYKHLESKNRLTSLHEINDL